MVLIPLACIVQYFYTKNVRKRRVRAEELAELQKKINELTKRVSEVESLN